MLRTNSQVQTLLYCALESSSSSEVQSLIEMAIEKSKSVNSIIENKPESHQQPKTPTGENKVDKHSLPGTFAERLRLAIAYSGMTQVELAKKIGVSQSTISQVINGKVSGVCRTSVIAKALGIDRNWLAYGEGEMTDFCTSKTEEL
ncbi:helix-turn-helix domain-containing protein [Proteus mirabilis]